MNEVEVILRENYSKMSEDYNRLRAEHAHLNDVVNDLMRELNNISSVRWDDMAHEDFVYWARSRAKFAIDQAQRKLGHPGLYEKAQSSKTPITDSLKATLEPLVNPYAITDDDPIELQDAPKHIAEAVKRQKMEQEALKKQYAEQHAAKQHEKKVALPQMLTTIIKQLSEVIQQLDKLLKQTKR